jgi:hypothetical protein
VVESFENGHHPTKAQQTLLNDTMAKITDIHAKNKLIQQRSPESILLDNSTFSTTTTILQDSTPLTIGHNTIMFVSLLPRRRSCPCSCHNE